MKKHITLFVMLCMTICAWATNYKTISNIAYHTDGNDYAKERCMLDFYYPEGEKDFPVVVWFHGGGLIEGNKYIPEELKDAGLGVIAVNYRLMPKCSIRECFDDAAAAVAWAFKEAPKYGASAKKVFISGHSAGATLVDMVALNKEYLFRYGIDADDIAGVFPFSGQVIDHYNLRKFEQQLPPLISTIGKDAPIYYTRKLAQPMVILSGDRELELFGRYEETAWFWRMMKLAGNEQIFIYELDGYDHGNMPGPAFAIMKRYIKAICNGEELKR